MSIGKGALDAMLAGFASALPFAVVIIFYLSLNKWRKKKGKTPIDGSTFVLWVLGVGGGAFLIFLFFSLLDIR